MSTVHLYYRIIEQHIVNVKISRDLIEIEKYALFQLYLQESLLLLFGSINHIFITLLKINSFTKNARDSCTRGLKGLNFCR